MKKQTKVLVAAAMLTLGASFTSLAATYDWQLEDGEWVCYDADGELYEDEWCESNGKDYYVGDDGIMVKSQWVDEYYVDSTGAKTTNAWKYILPADADEDDEDAKEEWFWFGSKGKVTTGKKVIDGTTYYFDNEGVMLTGWIECSDDTAAAAEEYSSSMVYAHESGARAKSEWIKVYEPGVDEEEDDVDEDDMVWYYIGSKGKPSTGREVDINGETYFFAEDGKMLNGWVATTNADAFFDLAENDYGYSTIEDVKAEAKGDVYFCGDSDQGWAKKSTWIKEYRSSVYADPDADDDSQYWFWLGSKGKVLVGDDKDAAKVTFLDGEGKTYDEIFEEKTTATNKASFEEISNKTYAFNQNGEMISGLAKIGGKMYYFGGSNDGAMKTGQVTIEDDAEEEAYKFFFAKKTDSDEGYTEGVAVTGAASGDLYNNGLIVTHDKDEEYQEVEVGGLFYVIDEDGDIKTSKKAYKNDDDKVYLDTTDVTFGTKGVKKGSYTTSAKVTVE